MAENEQKKEDEEEMYYYSIQSSFFCFQRQFSINNKYLLEKKRKMSKLVFDFLLDRDMTKK
jgi:hypothetical protein